MSWIKCSERMPAYEQTVIAYSTKHGVLEAKRANTDARGDHWWCDFLVEFGGRQSAFTEKFAENTVTHWMPLPEPPND